MTTPHPHAEFFRAIADGDSPSNWEGVHCAYTDYSTLSPSEIQSIFSLPRQWIVRRKPTPKVIDWSQLGRHVPVRFWDECPETSCISYLKMLRETEMPFDNGHEDFMHASLDTGLWVANHDGVNPWPAGVVVEVRMQDGEEINDYLAENWEWDLDLGEKSTIIMSRFHSLEYGYSFGGDS